MTIRSDIAIRKELTAGRLGIDPAPADQCIQPASVDLTLGSSLMDPYSEVPQVARNLYTLLPGECMLGTTAETVKIPHDMVARVEGKSSWGRRFIMVHATAGFVDPGFHGQITLELVNLSACPQVLPVGEPIAQISFAWLDQAAARPYGHPDLNSHYQGQMGATASVAVWR